MKTKATLLIALISLVALTGCPPKTGTVITAPQEDFEAQLPPGKMGLALVDPKDVPDFTAACSDLKELRKAVQYSIDYMSKPSSRAAYAAYGPEFTHGRALASLKAFYALLDTSLTPERLNAEIRQKFDVYTSVGVNRNGVYTGEVLFTGYYTPIFDASPVRTERFKYPIYKQPADLQKAPDGTILGKYPSRKELESQPGRLAGLELYWLGDPFEVYIAHVQGSAKLRMADGKLVTVGYTANNGLEYHSPGKDLVAEGKIPKGKLSLRTMIDYFKAHPEEINEYTWRNPRFVFFAQTGDDPHGCLNVPVTPWRSVATDKTIFPRACVTFVAVGMPRRNGNLVDIAPQTSFAVDQDAGGAIRAPARTDVYMGVGDEAGELAGRTQEKGRLYYLLLKKSNAGAPLDEPAAAAAPAMPGAMPPPGLPNP